MGFSTHAAAEHANLANLIDDLTVKHIANVKHPMSKTGKDLPGAFGRWIEQERYTSYRPTLNPVRNRAESVERRILAAAWNDAMSSLGQDGRTAFET